MPFLGIRQYLDAAGGQLHVLQTHGMGRNSAASFCAEEGENLTLQRAVVDRLGFHPLNVDDHSSITPVMVGKTRVGAYSTRVYVDSANQPKQALYFTCLVWGDASDEIKQHLLDLDGDLRERDERYRQRALVNRIGKDFVNQRFSDPMIYVGPYGEVIRRAVWRGIVESARVQRTNAAAFASRAGMTSDKAERPFLSSMPTILISDSLGSRVVFDVLTLKDAPTLAPAPATSPDMPVDRDDVLRRIRSIFMLANQLPLLSLAQLQPPRDDMPLATWLKQAPCPLPSVLSLRADTTTTIVAMTDVNDILSYHLSDTFKRRCESPSLRIVNVTLRNTPSILGLYANPEKAHASGFKSNRRALDYLVFGNHPPSVGENASAPDAQAH